MSTEGFKYTQKKKEIRGIQMAAKRNSWMWMSFPLLNDNAEKHDKMLTTRGGRVT